MMKGNVFVTLLIKMRSYEKTFALLMNQVAYKDGAHKLHRNLLTYLNTRTYSNMDGRQSKNQPTEKHYGRGRSDKS